MDEEAEGTTETPEPETGKGLRAQLEKQVDKVKDRDATIADLTTKLLSQAYADLNLDPTTGLGKAIAKEYEGDPTLAGLSAYAKDEYGYEHTPADPAHPEAAIIAQGQAALDQVGQTAGSVVDSTPGEVLAKAEAEGDYATTMAIKGQQLADML